MATIFISHSQHDIAVVAAMARGIEQAGYHTWYSERDLQPGTSRTSQISDAISQAESTVLVVSSHSATSHQVTTEALDAFERGKPLLPVLVDVTPAQLQELETGWWDIVRGSTVSGIGGSIEDATAQIIERLKAHGILPEARLMASPILKAVATSVDKPLPKSLAEKILASRASME